ncbi:hypothetical protein [Listeria immobilis]|uniref:hypothetical protein n=1 Tax=Listeria immobilis TaxID=2713502 RepID=UPI001C8A7989|nr:hypothetical protein [Listeria immobilis]
MKLNLMNNSKKKKQERAAQLLQLNHEQEKSYIKLDNTSIIHLASKNKKWINLFRLSVSLKDPVDPKILQLALNKTVKRFPTVAARIHKGAFWYYQLAVNNPPKVIPDQNALLCYMSDEELEQCAFRVLYAPKAIHVEIFHALTDGRGGEVFLKSLLAEYLTMKHHISIPAVDGILERTEAANEAEFTDKYLEVADSSPQKLPKEKHKKIYQFREEAGGALQLTTIKLSVKELKKLAKKLGVSLTVLIAAFVSEAILANQKEDKNQKDRLIKLFLPIDLRNFYPSQTLRNFVLYAKPEIDPKETNLHLTKIAHAIRQQLTEKLSEKRLRARITHNVRLEQNPIIKRIPLFIKRYLMKFFFSFSEKTTCLTLSNLGEMKVPEEMARYVECFDFILSPRSKTPYNIGVCSFDGELRINISRNAQSPLLENALFTLFTAQEIAFEVEKQ